MNIFRLIADMLHLAAILTLLYRIWRQKNCIGKLTHCLIHSASFLEFEIFLWTLQMRSIITSYLTIWSNLLHFKSTFVSLSSHHVNGGGTIITLTLGISCKTQEIYLLVFCVRYIDLFMYFVSVYNTCMKVFFISATAIIIWMMRYKLPYCTTYDALGD